MCKINNWGKEFSDNWNVFKQKKVFPAKRISPRHIWTINKPSEKIMIKNLFPLMKDLGFFMKIYGSKKY